MMWGEQMTTQAKSLYERLGGRGVIHALTESWVARAGGDDRTNGRFVRTDLPRLKQKVADQLANQLCEATGGPCTYTGRGRREAHAGMMITAGEFDVVMQHLRAALDELHVPKAEQDELVGLLQPMHDDIVEVDSPQTGTLRPHSHQAAPSLM
jgi:hemoglobin